MATNDETMFTQMNKETKTQDKQNLQSWQTVTIGGVTGILMGAGAMYAVDAFGKRTTNESEQDQESTDGSETATTTNAYSQVSVNGLHVAEVDQSLSFGQAFAAARAAVGAGGVFHWHGNIYNTYTAEEWNGMSSGEKAQFAQLVQPEIRPGEGRYVQKETADRTVKREEEVQKPKDKNEDVAQKPESKKEEEEEPEPQLPKRDPNPDGEVHFLGFSKVKFEGQEYEAGHLKNEEGKHVYLVDLDKDDKHEFDIAISDDNEDGILSSNESVDVSERHITEGEFALLSIMEEVSNDDASSATVQNSQDSIAPDMPDYINDANTNI